MMASAKMGPRMSQRKEVNPKAPGSREKAARARAKTAQRMPLRFPLMSPFDHIL